LAGFAITHAFGVDREDGPPAKALTNEINQSGAAGGAAHGVVSGSLAAPVNSVATLSM
jgi:hypothetical protein